jgi:hypothetical protein
LIKFRLIFWNKYFMKKFLPVAILLVTSVLAAAQPANDAICSAITLTASSGCNTYTNVAATTVAGDPAASCWATAKSNTVWFKFVATTTAMQISTDFTGDGSGDLNDTEIAVYSSSNNTCSGTLTQVGCDEDGGTTVNYNSVVSLTGLTVNNTYFVMVDGYGTATGDFCIGLVAAPSNDNCSGAIDITSAINSGSCTTYSSGAASASGTVTCAGGTNNDVWFKYTPTVDGVIDLTLTGISGTYDPILVQYTGSCASLTTDRCSNFSDDATYTDHIKTFAENVVAGTTYYLQIDGYSAETPSFCLNASLAGSTTPGSSGGPSNDFIGSSTSINSCGASFTTTNTGATGNYNSLSTSDDVGSGAANNTNLDANSQTTSTTSGVTYSVENDIWYKFCPLTVGSWTVSITPSSCSTTKGFQYSIFQGTETNLSTRFVCGDPNGASGYTSTVSYTINVTDITKCVFIQIDGYAGNVCTFGVSLSTTTCVLPIELLTFEAVKDQDNVKLTWVTATETNNNFFTVERTADGEHFEEIGIVKGAGTSKDEHSYQLIDEHPLNGQSFYRLKQTDDNGAFSYSNLVSVKFVDPTQDIHVVSNPINEELKISLASADNGFADVTLYDAAGSILQTKTFQTTEGINEMSLETSSLKEGFYMVTVFTGNTRKTFKVLKD